MTKPSWIHLIALLFLILWPGFTPADERVERLPERFRKWLEEEVVYIISEREKEFFLDLETIEERDAFTAAYWRRRDSDPLTEINEFQQEHHRRIEHANRLLGREAAIPGWKTDRGRMYIILGEPRDRSSFRNVGGIYPAEVWFYDGNREKGLPPFYLLFFQPGHAGAFRLYNHFTDRPERLIPTMGLIEENIEEAYLRLQEISPELANASISMRADQGGYALSSGIEVGALDSSLVLADIYESPHRRVDTSYIDSATAARGLVETEYMFNYMPSFAMANVLPGWAGGSLVHFSIEIDPQHLTLVKDEERFYTSFELHGEVRSSSEEILYEFSKVEYLQLAPSQLQQVQRLPFAYRNTFPLVDGDYQLRIVFKNRARNDYTLLESEVRVPERRRGEVLLGEPVLLYNVEELGSTQGPGFRIYELGSLRLHPNAKRVYAIGEPVRFHVPLAGASPNHQLRLQIASMENTSAPLQSKSTSLADYADGPIIETLELAEAVGGRYRLEVALVDPSGELVASQFAELDVTPRNAVSRPWVMYGTNDFALYACRSVSAAKACVTRRVDRKCLCTRHHPAPLARGQHHLAP